MISFKREVRVELGIALVCALVAVAIAVRWAHPGYVVYTQDTFWLSDPLNYLRKQLFVWNDYFSITGRYRSGLVLWPYLALVSLLSAPFGNSAGQMMAVGVVIAAGWGAMYAMLRLLRFAPMPALVASAGYTWNPWTMACLPQAYAYQWLFATGPLVGALLVAAARYPRLRTALLGGCALAAAVPTAVVGANPGLVLMLVLFVAFAAWAAYSAKPAPGFTRWIAVAGACSALAALWWLIPMILEYALSVPVAATQAASVDWVVRRAGFDNVLRFLPFWSWGFPQYYAYSQAYDGNLFSYASGFALFAAAVLSIGIREPGRARLARLGLAAGLIALFLAKGSHAPLGFINEIVYRLPGSAIWREPTTKFPLIALGGLAICCAALFERLAALSARASRALAAFAVAAFAVSCWPLLQGTLAFTPETPGVPSSYVAIPQYWYDAAAWLNARPGAGAALVLPADPFYQANYAWGLQAVDLLPDDVFHRQVIQPGNLIYTASSTDLSLFAYLAHLVASDSSDLIPALRALGVRYVVFRGDIVQPGAAVTEADVARELLVSPVRFGAISIFDLGPPSGSLLGASANWIEGEYGARKTADQLELADLTEDLPRVDAGAASAHPPKAPPAVFEADVTSNATGSRTAGGLRTLWQAPTQRFTARVSEASRVFYGVRHYAEQQTRSGISVAGTQLLPPGPQDEHTLLTVVNEDTPIGANRSKFTVFVPSDGPVIANISIGVVAHRPAAYVLSRGQQLYRDVIAGADAPVWAVFDGVWLSPGFNDLTLASAPAAAGRAAQHASGLRLDALRAIVERDAAHSEAAPLQTFAILDAAQRPHARVATLPLAVALSTAPVVEVKAAPSIVAILGAIVNFSLDGKPYRCYSEPDPSSSLDVEGAVLGCLGTAGIGTTQRAVNATFVRSIDIDAALPPNLSRAAGVTGIARVTADWEHPVARGLGTTIRIGRARFALPSTNESVILRTGISGPARAAVATRARDVSTGVLGTPPLALRTEPRTASGIFPLFAATRASNEFIRLRQGYSGLWLGMCFGACPLLPQHFRDDAGWNAWYVPGSGTLAFTNLAVVLAVFGALISAATVLVLLRLSFAGLRERAA